MPNDDTSLVPELETITRVTAWKLPECLTLPLLEKCQKSMEISSKWKCIKERNNGNLGALWTNKTCLMEISSRRKWNCFRTKRWLAMWLFFFNRTRQTQEFMYQPFLMGSAGRNNLHIYGGVLKNRGEILQVIHVVSRTLSDNISKHIL